MYKSRIFHSKTQSILKFLDNIIPKLIPFTNKHLYHSLKFLDEQYITSLTPSKTYSDLIFSQKISRTLLQDKQQQPTKFLIWTYFLIGIKFCPFPCKNNKNNLSRSVRKVKPPIPISDAFNLLMLLSALIVLPNYEGKCFY